MTRNLSRTPVLTAALGLTTLALLGLAAPRAHAQNPTGTIAYDNSAGVRGNQAYTGSLGLDFNVTSPIEVTQLGVFASSSSGSGLYHFTTVKHVFIFDRNNPAAPLATLTFTGGTDYTVTNGDAFQALAAPLLLPAGFQGSVVAYGYGDADPEHNTNGAANDTSTENDGGGLIQFVGGGRHNDSDSTNGQYPTTVDQGPTNRYDAGTFAFMAAPEPSQWAGLGMGALGLAGLVRKARKRTG